MTRFHWLAAVPIRVMWSNVAMGRGTVSGERFVGWPRPAGFGDHE